MARTKRTNQGLVIHQQFASKLGGAMKMRGKMTAQGLADAIVKTTGLDISKRQIDEVLKTEGPDPTLEMLVAFVLVLKPKGGIGWFIDEEIVREDMRETWRISE